jgi:PAS domain S-box-containing protein
MSKSNETAREPLDYRKLFQALPESYLLFEVNDPDFTIVEVNEARERVTGISREASIGRPLFEVFPDRNDDYRTTGMNELREYIRSLIKNGTAEPLQRIRYDIKQSDGTYLTRYWHPSYVLIRDNAGKPTHVLAASRDVTEETLVEMEIATMSQRLQTALEVGKVSSWMWDIEHNILVGDRNLAKLFSMDPAQVLHGLPLEAFLKSIHPDDLQRVKNSVQRTIQENVPFEEEYRTVTPQGKIRWVLARGKLEEQGGRKVFPGVIVDITERRDLQEQVELARHQDQLNRQESKILQKRNEELETVSRSKDEFVALASHQLRTPATAVKQYLGMVMQGYVGEISDIQAEMLGKAFESNERQIEIINQILNAARVDTGRLVMTTMPVDIRALVRGLTDDMRASIEQRHHQFVVRLPRTPMPVVADLGYLRMAIENVLHNASIYTQEGGRIEIHLERDGKQARLSITDTGVGIKKADIGKLFTKFSRIHNPLSVQAGGSGIGLYLTAEIIRLHGGKVTVRSKINQGTTFAILLPLAHNSAKAERDSSATAV